MQSLLIYIKHRDLKWENLSNNIYSCFSYYIIIEPHLSRDATFQKLNTKI